MTIIVRETDYLFFAWQNDASTVKEISFILDNAHAPYIPGQAK